jgi:hypothetical protein
MNDTVKIRSFRSGLTLAGQLQQRAVPQPSQSSAEIVHDMDPVGGGRLGQMIPNRVYLLVRPSWSQTMAREELKWQNIDADDLPADIKKSFDAMVEAEAAFKADLEKLLKNEGHMPEDKFLVMSRKGKRLGVAFASTPRGEGGAASLKFKTK